MHLRTYTYAHACSHARECVHFCACAPVYARISVCACVDVRPCADSVHVQSAKTVTANIRQHSDDQLKADAAFRLGNLFRAHGHSEKAEQYWEMAQALNPESINFIRQSLTLSEEGSAGETFMKLRGDYMTQGKDYYRPMDIEPS